MPRSRVKTFPSLPQNSSIALPCEEAEKGPGQRCEDIARRRLYVSCNRAMHGCCIQYITIGCYSWRLRNCSLGGRRCRPASELPDTLTATLHPTYHLLLLFRLRGVCLSALDIPSPPKLLAKHFDKVDELVPAFALDCGDGLVMESPTPHNRVPGFAFSAWSTIGSVACLVVCGQESSQLLRSWGWRRGNLSLSVLPSQVGDAMRLAKQRDLVREKISGVMGRLRTLGTA